MRLEAIIRSYIRSHRTKKTSELKCFAVQRSLKLAVEKAALAEGCQGKFRHQWRIKNKALKSAKHQLGNKQKLRSLRNARNFEALIKLVETECASIKGLGPLYAYDTALRIGAKRGIAPDKVHLHAGTRAGARKFGLNHRAGAIEMKDLPRPLRKLEPYEVEDVLCIYKGKFGPFKLKAKLTGRHNRGC